MPINAYIGTNGSGKTYEVVSSVIIPALKIGRRVVTNIQGIQPEKMISYCADKFKLPEEEVGRIEVVTDDCFLNDNFFPYKGSAPKDSFCQAGDLICVDEIWRFWGEERSGLPERHRSFIAEHRHFTHPVTGLSCDLVVINQSLRFCRFIKERIQSTFRMTKLLVVAKSKYRVDVFVGSKLTKSNLVNSFYRSYNKNVFSLYKSYDGGNGKEVNIDGRINIFSNLSFWAVLVVVLILGITGFSYTYRFFYSSNKSSKSLSKSPYTTKNSVNSGYYVDSKKLGESSAVTAKKAVLSATWRVAGSMTIKDISYVVLSDNQGTLRLEPQSSFSFHGNFLTGIVDEQRVTVFSGGRKP